MLAFCSVGQALAASAASNSLATASTHTGHATNETHLTPGKAPVASSTSRPASTSDIVVTDAWVRWLPGALPSAGYMTLSNTGTHAQTIVGASSPDYGMVMLHRTVHTDGKDTMTAVTSLPLPAGATVRAAPEASDGYHWMLMQPSHPITVGMQISLHVHLADGSTIVIPMLVSPPTRLH